MDGIMALIVLSAVVALAALASTFGFDSRDLNPSGLNPRDLDGGGR